jgi:hypothetical protein
MIILPPETNDRLKGEVLAVRESKRSILQNAAGAAGNLELFVSSRFASRRQNRYLGFSELFALAACSLEMSSRAQYFAPSSKTWTRR